MEFAGLDIGGANIKFASTSGCKSEIPFAIWKHKDQLTETLNQFRQTVAPDDLLGVTMTAELADCFESKKEGVKFIVDAVCDVFPSNSPKFYRTDGTMCDQAKAVEDWRLVAASNWHAMAWLAFKETKQKSGFVLDIGSTTTDIIPVRDGNPVDSCQNDYDRLKNGQLYYAGVGRTPICSLIDQVEIEDGEFVPLAREFFATIEDAFVILNEVPEDKDCFDTADGRPRTVKHATQRILRMACSDTEELTDGEVDHLARQIATQAARKLMGGIGDSLLKVINGNPDLPLCFVSFGGGAWLATKTVCAQCVKLSADPTNIFFGNDRLANQTTPAFAVAKKREEVFEATGF